MATFEGYERRIDQINPVLAQYGLKSLEEADELLKSKGIDVRSIVLGIQPIAFENAVWAYTLGAAIAVKKNVKTAAEASECIGEGLQTFCIPGSVADQRKVGIGHGNLGAMLLSEGTKCFAFLAGHESFAAAEGAIGIARTANKVRKEPLQVILNGLGKDAAQIISRINGFTHCETEYNQYTGELTVTKTTAYSKGERANVRCYGADDVNEGVAIMRHESVDVSITGNSTNPTRFQHPGRRHLQEVVRRERQKVLFRCFRRRHWPYPAPRQHGCRPLLLRHDRHHGPYAFRRPVCRQLLRARPR